MLMLTSRLDNTESRSDAVLFLPYELRQKSRFRTTLGDGTEVGVVLPRGGTLSDGDLLCGEDGRVVRVQAAPEAVSRVECADPLLLARAAYHLGNRHVQLQLGEGWLRYPVDHVLDAMCRQLGLRVSHQQAPFEPENGAYGGGHQHGAHGHNHGHGHG